MSMLLMYIKAFVVGGILCAIGQVLILKTQLTSARILVGYVTTGVILGALGIYKPLVDFAGAGATGAAAGLWLFAGTRLAGGGQGNRRAGRVHGGITATAGGISAAIFFGYLAAVLFKPKMKA